MRRRPKVRETRALALQFEARSQGWGLLGPGGGGALFLPAIGKNYIFVTCDMGPAFASLDAGVTWRLVDLDAPILAHESRSDKVRALSLGVWESNSSLTEWRLIFPSDDRARVALEGDHAEPHFVDAPHPIAFAESTRGHLSVVASSNENTKLFSRAPGSDVWVAENVVHYQPNALVNVGEALFAIDPERGIVNFRNDQVILPSRGTTQLVATEGSAFAITNENADDPLSGATDLWYSQDEARTFRKVTGALQAAVASKQARIVSIAVSSKGTLIASFKTEERFGVVESTDHCASFTALFIDGDRKPASNVFDPWIANRFEPSWADAPLGLAIDDDQTRVATDYGRVLVSHDSGQSWTGAYAARTSAGAVTTTGINTTTAYGVHADPFDHARIILASADIGGFVSEDAARSWAPCSGVPRAWRNTMYWAEFDPHVRGRVLAAVSDTHDLPRPKMWRRKSPLSFRGGIIHSEDGGRSWHHRAKGIPDAAVTQVLTDPASGGHGRWFACVLGHGIFTSTDGGETWAQSSTGLSREPTVWSLSRAEDGTLYAVMARRAEGDNALPGAVFVSSSNGTNWRALALPKNVTGPTSLIADPFLPKRLVLSAWGWHHPERNTQGGIFVSDDSGDTWKRVLARDNFIFSISRDPVHTKRIYATGFSGTAWRSDDAGDTFLPIRGFRYKNAHRAFADRINDGYIYIATFGAGLWHGLAETDAGAKTISEEFPRRRAM